MALVQTSNQIGNISNTRMIVQATLANWKNYIGLLKHCKPRRDLFEGKVNGRRMKYGDTTFLDLPNSYTTGNGPDITNTLNGIQNVLVPFVINMHKHCAVQITSREKTLNIDDDPKSQEWLDQVVDPAVKNLIANVASDMTAQLTMGISSVYVTKESDGTIATPGLNEWAQANAALERLGVPGYAYKVALSPDTSASSAVSMAQLYNPTMTIGDQTTKGRMTSPIGGVMEWYRDIYIPLCTTGSYTGGATATGTVSPYVQSSQTSMPGFNTYYASFGSSVISCSAISGTLNQGDFITIEGVYECNRLTGQSTGYLKTFTVMENVTSGSTSIPVSPSIIGPKSNGGFSPFQTVASLPASGAAITPVLPAGSTYRRNVMFLDDTFYLAFVEMSLETPGAESSRVSGDLDESYFSTIAAYQYNNTSMITTARCDILGGGFAPFSDRGVIVPHVVSTQTPATTKTFVVPKEISKIKT